MKKFSIVIIIFLCLAFCVSDLLKKSSFRVLKVINSTEIIADLNHNSKADSDEQLCIAGIEPPKTIEQEYVSRNFTEAKLADKRVKIKLLKEKTEECRSAKVFTDNQDFAKVFQQSIKTPEQLKRLNLVIYNNKSNKYHKPDCKYAQIAHDKILTEKRLLPKSAAPCKFCHLKPQKTSTPQPIAPTLITRGDVQIFLNDYTSVLKPNKNCSTNFCKALLKEINSAKTSIDFAVYGYENVPQIESALKNAKSRNVEIRFVFDQDENGANIYSDTEEFSKTFPENKSDRYSALPSALMHNKFFIFDNAKVLAGSTNLSSSDMSGFNSNAGILINSAEVAKVFAKEFEQMFEGKFHAQKTQNCYESANLSVYFSPKNETITRKIIPLVNSAKSYIYIPAFLLTHQGLSTALANAKSRNVDVKIILDATNASSPHSKHNALRALKIPIKTENFAGKLHSKSIIIDDTYLVIGSMNFSRSGEIKNDENVIIIKNSELAKFYRVFFNSLWQKIPDRWLTQNARAEGKDSIGSCSDGIDNDYDGKIDALDSACR